MNDKELPEINSLAPLNAGLFGPGVMILVAIVAGVMFLASSKTDKQPDQNARIAQLETELTSVRAELAAAKAKKSSASSGVSHDGGAAPTIAAANNEREQQTERTESAAGEGRRQWRAERMVQAIEAHVALSAAERKELFSKLAELPAATREERRKLLADVIGAERAEEFVRLRQEAEAREEEEQIQTEAVKIARRLNLNAEQEAKVQDALRTVTEALRPAREELSTRGERAMALHSSDEPSGDELRATYEEMRAISEDIQKQEREKLLATLSGTLTDAQLNELAAAQAEERRGGRFRGF